MDLSFEKVTVNDDLRMNQVYEIIKSSGEQMYNEYNLIHWKDPYPMESIQRDCRDKDVFIIKDNEHNVYVHTFQLEFLKEDTNNITGNHKKSIAYINKFATLPKSAGKGTGKKSIEFIEDYCKARNISKISLDVYNKSQHAINFYLKRGFRIIGSKRTKHFTVELMEKNLL